eukprot:gene62574-85570_t
MHGIGLQEPAFNRAFGGGGEGIGAIRTERVGRQQRVIFQHLTEEALGGIESTLRRQQDIHRIAMFVDGSVQIAPFAADPPISLVSPDRSAMWPAELAKSFPDHRRMRQNPAIDDPDNWEDTADTGSPPAQSAMPIMPSLEIILRLALQLFGKGIQNHRTLHTIWSGKFSSDGQNTVKRGNLRQALSAALDLKRLTMHENDAVHGIIVAPKIF